MLRLERKEENEQNVEFQVGPSVTRFEVFALSVRTAHTVMLLTSPYPLVLFVFFFSACRFVVVCYLGSFADAHQTRVAG